MFNDTTGSSVGIPMGLLSRITHPASLVGMTIKKVFFVFDKDIQWAPLSLNSCLSNNECGKVELACILGILEPFFDSIHHSYYSRQSARSRKQPAR